MLDGFDRAVARHRLLWLAAIGLLAAACSGVETNFQTAATGTRLEAEQVVALVYAQAPDGEIDKLLYHGGDLTRAIRRVRDRHAELKPWLDQGAIGNSLSGFVALRDAAQVERVNRLLVEENRDRAFLYTQVSVEVGHGRDTLASWLPYTSHAFGKEWVAQGRAGWWWLDDEQVWRLLEKVGAGGTAAGD